MTLVVTHSKVSSVPDGTDTSVVRPSDWNANHALAGVADIAQGGTGASTAPAAMANLMGFTTTATAAGTTTLTNTSTFQQVFTGTSTQTIVLPVTSTLAQGWSFEITNNSTGNLTVNSSGGNLVATILPGTTASLVCILTSGTTAASWDYDVNGFGAVTGTGSVVLSNSPTLVTPALGTPSSGNLANCTFPTLNQNTTGSSASCTGNANTATTLQTARSINGTSFNGSADITTGKWGTARTLTLGSTGKSVDGSGNVSWTLAEIGAQAALGFTPANKAGDTFTGAVRFSGDTYLDASGYSSWAHKNYQGAVYYNNGTKDRIKIDNDNFTNFGYATKNEGTTESWFETNTSSASADNKRWRFGHYASDAVWALETVNDAYSSATRRFAVDRSGNGYLNGNKILTYANTSYTATAMGDLFWGINNGGNTNWVAIDFGAVGYRLIAHGRATIYHQGDYNHFTGFMRLYNISTGAVITDCYGFVGGNNGDVMDINFSIAAWVQVGQTYRLEIQLTKANGNGPSILRNTVVSVLNAPN